jgi:hypothetical protein
MTLCKTIRQKQLKDSLMIFLAVFNCCGLCYVLVPERLTTDAHIDVPSVVGYPDPGSHSSPTPPPHQNFNLDRLVTNWIEAK